MDPYQILGIKKGATRKQIKQAYRKKSRETHPDLNPGKHELEFLLVAWANKTITNPDKALPCPVQPPKPEWKVVRKPVWQKPKPETGPPDLNPSYARDDPTLRYYDDNLRDHLMHHNVYVDGYRSRPLDPVWEPAFDPAFDAERVREWRRASAAHGASWKPEHKAPTRRRAPTVTVAEIMKDDPSSYWQKKWREKMRLRGH